MVISSVERQSGQKSRSSRERSRFFKKALAVSTVALLLLSALSHHSRSLRGLDAIGFFDNNKAAAELTPTFGSPLQIPQGKAQALPSIRVEAAKDDIDRGVYGGRGDKKHLGGFTKYDGEGISPAVWKHMITNYGIKSLIDIGCGKGVSSLWFLLHGVDVLCVEGSHDAVEQTLLPNPALQVVEHDYSRGPFWPEETYDAVWSVEFLEHVGRNFQFNYIQTMRKAALIFVTHSQWGGWHHVEVHNNEWWITKFESFGFKYSKILTDEIKRVASKERDEPTGILGPNGKPFNAQHIWLNMQVFINPMVASLPKHAHLFAEHGCYQDRTKNGEIIHKECGALRGGNIETKLPESFYPLVLTPEQDQEWLERMKASFGGDEANEA